MNHVPRPVHPRRLQHRRSRNGCLTCKRRKVRCNEEKPLCYHCRRLHLDCLWKDLDVDSQQLSQSDAGEKTLEQPSPTEFFDFTQSIDTIPDIFLPVFSDFAPDLNLQDEVLLGNPSPSPSVDIHNGEALQVDIPPILDPIENGPKGTSVQALLNSLARSSSMVRHSMAAFAVVRASPSDTTGDFQAYYEKAASRLSQRCQEPSGTRIDGGDELRYSLATIFFLTYADLLTGRLDLAYSNLAWAHRAIQVTGTSTLGSIEQRILSWIRLLDARAAAAGGEGLLINDTIHCPPTPTSTSAGSTPRIPDATPDCGSQDVIYDMLCQPGIAFYQQVQTITGRITRIAHIHRSRGSVEDETEVMAIAANILHDLGILYDRRPALMDYAVSGNISALAEPLASGIIRSFQTYLANFYACYIHLHRVAHRHLARSAAVDTALEKIKEILHLMVAKNESIPVNMLWPLFLWGSEEDDPGECRWILTTIQGLHHVASNSSMAAGALGEIQRRQREAGGRVDIRSVCLELFNTTFAIV
ncbi:Zn(II)2Cys6 transcription factor [Aspergillus puulaauensis]|uniref:Zn(2)-C6 fungal-type domain-containing protein n=1 Tax=Aspergillus puulaauensis TaxID=1220207 RepID=A0A7R7XLA6_9EURO|nr:uncharacterized protein APUU_40055S [Aspergillus puulaauensis]BCS23611.1 hypothetical protein APUU_40055S [Aspergillus puulaauensis]